MRRDDRICVQHMTDAAEAALRFTRDRTRTDLGRDELLVFPWETVPVALPELLAKLRAPRVAEGGEA